MSESDPARRPRCRALQLAIVLGVLLPIFQPTWITLATAIVGIAILAVLYRRECWDEGDRDSAH